MKPTVSLLLGLSGIRRPATNLTRLEASRLMELAGGLRSAVEVGVDEGATSRRILAAMAPAGRLYLVDSYPARLRLERWIGRSLTAVLARRSVRSFGDRACFVPMSSIEAARKLALHQPAELVFLDARHDYESVREDIGAWKRRLGPGGRIAVHDAVPCSGRPELRADVGACLAVAEWIGKGLRALEPSDSLAVLELDASAGGAE